MPTRESRPRSKGEGTIVVDGDSAGRHLRKIVAHETGVPQIAAAPRLFLR
jgi:hypothetical protein